MQPLQALAVALALFGVLAGLIGINRSLRHRRGAALAHAGLGIVLLVAAVLLWPVGRAMTTFELARTGQPVADLYFERLADSRFRATLTRLPRGRMQVFELGGNAWRLDARTLTWHGWASDLGFGPRIQLDRLTGLVGTADSDARAVSTYDLSDPAGVAFWQRARVNEQWRRIVEARQVYGANMAMADRARFVVVLSERGLDARPFVARPGLREDDGEADVRR
jgi:hypothetical protein